MNQDKADLMARVHELEETVARLERIVQDAKAPVRPRSGSVRWAPILGGLFVGLMVPAVALSQSGFSWPAGWNVFAADTPARADEVNDNFQWILSKIGTDAQNLTLSGALQFSNVSLQGAGGNLQVSGGSLVVNGQAQAQSFRIGNTVLDETDLRVLKALRQSRLQVAIASNFNGDLLDHFFNRRNTGDGGRTIQFRSNQSIDRNTRMRLRIAGGF